MSIRLSGASLTPARSAGMTVRFRFEGRRGSKDEDKEATSSPKSALAKRLVRCRKRNHLLSHIPCFIWPEGVALRAPVEMNLLFTADSHVRLSVCPVCKAWNAAVRTVRTVRTICRSEVTKATSGLFLMDSIPSVKRNHIQRNLWDAGSGSVRISPPACVSTRGLSRGHPANRFIYIPLIFRPSGSQAFLLGSAFNLLRAYSGSSVPASRVLIFEASASPIILLHHGSLNS